MALWNRENIRIGDWRRREEQPVAAVEVGVAATGIVATAPPPPPPPACECVVAICHRINGELIFVVRLFANAVSSSFLCVCFFWCGASEEDKEKREHFIVDTRGFLYQLCTSFPPKLTKKKVHINLIYIYYYYKLIIPIYKFFKDQIS